VPLYEIVLRREGLPDEIRLTDHAGFSVGDSLQVGRYDCLVASTTEVSKNRKVTQRVVCRPAADSTLDSRTRRQALLGEALDKFVAAAFVFDARGQLAAVNQAATTMTGYTRAELVELSAAELMPEPATAPARVAAVVAGALRHGDSAIRQKDGTVLAVRFRVDTTTLASGETFYLSLCWPLL
jgi:PAS domain S-box-containing protein